MGLLTGGRLSENTALNDWINQKGVAYWKKGFKKLRRIIYDCQIWQGSCYRKSLLWENKITNTGVTACDIDIRTQHGRLH